MLLDLLNQYTVKSATDSNSCTLINMFLEEQQKVSLRQSQASHIQDEYEVIAYPTFGLTLFSDTTLANVRALIEQNDTLYVVAGNKFGSVASNGTFSILGTLNTSTGFAKIKAITGGNDSNNQLIIIDGTNGYSYNLGTSTATFPIADADFPQTCTDITTLDDYVFAMNSNSIKYNLSGSADSLSWEALDFASKTRLPDRLCAMATINGEIYLIGTKSVEIHIDSGNSTFPIERRNDVFIESGCAAKNSVVVIAGSLMYLAKSRTGGYGIIQINNYVPNVVSTKAIMYLINSFSTVSDAVAYGYAKDGHEFYEITFPTADKTLTLDVSNGLWSIRTSNLSGTYGRFLGACSAFCYGKSFIGDSQSGKIYYQDSTAFTENSIAIKRQFVSPHIYEGGLNIEMAYLQIDVQTNVGSNKTFLLEKSCDHGNTWISVGTFTVPTVGSGMIRVPALGTSTVWTFRITTTDNFKFVLLGFQAQVKVSSW